MEYIACSNVVFGLLDGGFVALVGEIAFWFNIFLSVTKITRLLRKRALKVAYSVHHALGSLCIGGACRQTVRGPSGGYDDHLTFDAIQNGCNCRAQEDGIRQPEGIFGDIWQMLDKADHIISEVAKEASRSGGQVFGHLYTTFSE